MLNISQKYILSCLSLIMFFSFSSVFVHSVKFSFIIAVPTYYRIIKDWRIKRKEKNSSNPHWFKNNPPGDEEEILAQAEVKSSSFPARSDQSHRQGRGKGEPRANKKKLMNFHSATCNYHDSENEKKNEISSLPLCVVCLFYCIKTLKLEKKYFVFTFSLN